MYMVKSYFKIQSPTSVYRNDGTLKKSERIHGVMPALQCNVEACDLG